MISIMSYMIPYIILPIFILYNSNLFSEVKIKSDPEAKLNFRLNQITPEKPGYGDTITIKYDPKLQQIEFPQIPNDISLLTYKNTLDPPETIEMEKKNGFWETSLIITDTSISMILFAYKLEYSLISPIETLLDDNNGNFWDIIFYNTDGTPVKGAYQARALSYTSSGGIRTENLYLALQEIKKELSHYPDNYTARRIYYTILLKTSEFSESTRRKIKNEIDSLINKNYQNERIMNFAINSFRMIGEMDKAQKIEAKLIKQNPKSNQAAMKSFEKILKIEDPSTRIERLEKFLLEFPETHLIEIALSNLATSAIEINDSTRMMIVGDKLLAKSTTPAAASALATIAGFLSEKQIENARSIAYAERALTLTRSLDPSIRPPEISIKEWEEQLRSTEARYRDILGWAYFRQGKFDRALKELQAAAQGIFHSNVFYHLAVVLQNADSTEKALLQYARTAAFGGEIGNTAKKDFEDLWLKSKKNPDDMKSFLDDQAKWVDETYRNRILSKRSIRPAPDFELEDLKGDFIRLSDQNDSVVILCFWASWSRSSRLILQELHNLAETFGQIVLFLTITTDIKQSEARKFAKKERLIFPVLFNDETARNYNLQGVPTLFIIDRERNIHFEHKGYRPDINEVLAIELESLL